MVLGVEIISVDASMPSAVTHWSDALSGVSLALVRSSAGISNDQLKGSEIISVWASK